MAFPSNEDIQQTAKPDGLDLGPATAMQAQSASSDMPSLSQTSSFPPPLSVSPEPAYIAASAASQIVSASWDSGDVMVSQQALALLNAFLDWVLFNIISNVRSTKLCAIRISVSEVLKPRLAKEAVAGADDELKEYLAAGEEEEEDSSDSEDGRERIGDSALELIWKLARLRCMVYTRLGDVEEDQEEAYIVQERLDGRGAGYAPDSGGHTIVSAASAIFLTSVLEYLGELALYHAGQATQRRTFNLNLRSTLPGLPERIVVEETDMLQVGREIPLQRLWRTWRHQIRAPKDSNGKSLSRESSFYGSEPSRISLSRQNGLASPQAMIGHHRSGSGPQLYRSRDGQQLPRPIPENEIDDGKLVGRFHRYDDTGIVDTQEKSASMSNKHNRRSRSVNNVSAASPPTSVSPESDATSSTRTPIRPTLGRARSSSLPTPTRTPLPDARRSDNGTTIDRPGEADRGAFTSPTSFNSRVTEGVEPAQGSLPLSRGRTEDPSTTSAIARALSAIAGTIGTASLARSHSPYANEHSLPEVAKPTPYLSTKEQVVHDDQSSLPPTEQLSPGACPDHPVTEDPQCVMQVAEAVPYPTAANLTADPEDLALSDTEATSTSSPRSPNREAFVLGPMSSGRPSRPSDVSHSTATDLRAPSDQSKVGLHTKAKQQDGLNLGSSSRALKNHNAVANDSLDNTMITGVGPWPFVDGSSSRDRRFDSSARSESEHFASSGHIEDPSSSSSLQDSTRNQDRQQQMAATASSGTKRKQIPVSTAESVEHPVQSSSTRTRPDTATSQMSSSRLSATLQSSPYGNPEMTDKRLSRDSNDKKKSLEHLIQGNETLHYTLTPGPAREATTTYPPGTSKTQTQELADFLKTTAPPGVDTARPKTDGVAVPGNAVNDSKSQASDSQSKRVSAVAAASSPTRKELPSRSKSSLIATRLTAGGPRDPKAITPTTRDLADYAKSTGPENDRQLAHALTSRPGTAGTSKEPLPQKPLPQRPTFQPSNHNPKGSMSTTADKGYKTKISNPPKEPRDATGRSQSVHELADFLREGPPREPGDHRISRKVAPFRTTMDSDDLNGLVSSPEFAQQEPVGRPSAASTQESSAAKSVPSSLNSRTALLDSSSRAPRRHINGMTQDPSSRIATLPQTVEVETRPKRKQRRVRDPYAVDLDDDDEDVEGGVPIAQPKSQDESLIDFLRNTSPAVKSTMKVQPFILTGQHASTARGLQKTPSRMSSATGLLRSASRVASNFPTKSDEKFVRLRSATVRADSPHLTQKGNRLDSYKPTQGTHAPHLDRAQRISQSENLDKPDKSSEPNGALNETTEVRDFAPRDEGGFIRFFSRRKKSTA